MTESSDSTRLQRHAVEVAEGLGYYTEDSLDQRRHPPIHHYPPGRRLISVRIGSRELDVLGSGAALRWIAEQYGHTSLPGDSVVFAYGVAEPAVVLAVLARWADDGHGSRASGARAPLSS